MGNIDLNESPATIFRNAISTEKNLSQLTLIDYLQVSLCANFENCWATVVYVMVLGNCSVCYGPSWEGMIWMYMNCQQLPLGMYTS